MKDKSDIGSDLGKKNSQTSAPQSDRTSSEDDNEKEETGEKEKSSLRDRNGSFQESTPTQQQSKEEGSQEEELEETSTQSNNLPNSDDESIPVSVVISDESAIEAFAQNPQRPQILVAEPPQSPPVSASDPSSSSESPEPEEGLGREYPSHYSEIPMGNMSEQYPSRLNDSDTENIPGPFLTGSQNVSTQDTSKFPSSTTGNTPRSSAMVPGNGNLRFEDIQEDIRFEKMLYEDDTEIDKLPGQSDKFRKIRKNNNEDRVAIKPEDRISTTSTEGISGQKDSTDTPTNMEKGIDKSNFDTVRDTRSFDERKAGRVEAMSEEEQIEAAIQASLGQPTNFDDPSPTLPENEYTEATPAADKVNYNDGDKDWFDNEKEEIPLARVWSRSEEQRPEDLELTNFHKKIWLSKLDKNTAQSPGDVFGPKSSRFCLSKSKQPVGSRSTSSSAYTRLAKDDTSGNSSTENDNDDNIYGLSPELGLGSQTTPSQLTPQVLTREIDKASLEREALQEEKAELREQQELLVERIRILQEEVDLQEALRRSMVCEDSRWHPEGSSKTQRTEFLQHDRSVQQIELPKFSSRYTDRAQEFRHQYLKVPSELRYRRIRPRQILSGSSFESLYHGPYQRNLPLRKLESNLSSTGMDKDDTITMISNQKLASATSTVIDPSPVLMSRSNNMIPLQAIHSVKPMSEGIQRTESKLLPAKQIHSSPLVQEHIMKNRDFLRPLTPIQPKPPKENVSSQKLPLPNKEVNDESKAMSREKTVIWNPIGATPHLNTKAPISSATSMEKMPDGQNVRQATPAPLPEDHLGSFSHIEDTLSSPYSSCLSNVPLPKHQATVIPTMQELQELVNDPKNSPPKVQEALQCKLHFQALGDEMAILATSKKRKSAEGERMFKHIRQRRRSNWKQSNFQKERAFTQAFRPVPKADKSRCTTIIPHSDLCFSESINGVEEFVKKGRAWQKRRQYLDHNHHHQYGKFKTYIHSQSQATTLRDSTMFGSDWQRLCEEEFIARERKNITDEILKMTKLYDRVLHERNLPSQNSKNLDELDTLLNSMYARGSVFNMGKYNVTSKEDCIRYRVEQISGAQTEFVTFTLWTSCRKWVSGIINEDIPMFQKMHHVHGSSEPSQWLRKMHERREIRRITVKFLNGLRPNDRYDEFIVPPLGPYPHLKKEPRTMGRSTSPYRERIYTNTQRPRVAKMAPGEGANKLLKYREKAQAEYGLELERPYSVAERKNLPPLGTDTPRPGTFADPINLNNVNHILMSDASQGSETPQSTQNTQDTQDPQNPQERIAYEQRKIQSAAKSHSDLGDRVTFDKPLLYPDNDPDDHRCASPEDYNEKPLRSLGGISENNLNKSNTEGKVNHQHLSEPKDPLNRLELDRVHTEKDVQLSYSYPNSTPENTQAQQKEDESSHFRELASSSEIPPEVDTFKSYKSTIAQLEARHGRNKSPYPQGVFIPEDRVNVNHASSIESIDVGLTGAMDIDSPGNTLDLDSSPPNSINDLKSENKTLRNLIQALLFQTSDEQLVSTVHRIRASENLEDDIESMIGLREVDRLPDDMRDSLEDQGDLVQHKNTITSQQNNPTSDRLLSTPSNAPLMAAEASSLKIRNDFEALLPQNGMTRSQSPSDDLRKGGNTTASDIRSRLMKQRRSPASISMKKIEEVEQPPAIEGECEGQAKETVKKQKDEYYSKLKTPRLISGTSLIADITSASGEPMSVQEWAVGGVKNYFGLDTQETGSEAQNIEQEDISSEQEGPREQAHSQRPEILSDDVEMVDIPQGSEASSSRDDSSRQNISAETAHPSADGAELGNVPTPTRKRSSAMSRTESDYEKDSSRKRRKSSNDDVSVGEMPSSSRKRSESMSRDESDDEKESPRKRRRTRLSRMNRDR